MIAIVVGFTGGWVYQTSSQESATKESQPSSTVATDRAKTDTSQAKSEPLAVAGQNSILSNNVGTDNEVTPLMFIERLSLMTEEEIRRLFYGSGGDRQRLSNALVVGLLQELPTISDSTLRYRLIDVLNSSRLYDARTQSYVVEDWVLGKVRSFEAEDYWLEVLSNFGVEKIDNIGYLAGRLDEYHESSSRVSALLAISRTIGFEILGNTTEEAEQISDLVKEEVATYLDSENEPERAAAVRVLRQFPTENIVQHLSDALADPSERVRLGAIRAMGGGLAISPDNEAIKRILLQRMQASDASDAERLGRFRH